MGKPQNHGLNTTADLLGLRLMDGRANVLLAANFDGVSFMRVQMTA